MLRTVTENAMPDSPSSAERHHLYTALACFLAWGFFPIYWKFLHHISALETLSQRIVWSFVFYLIIFAWRQLRGVKFLVKTTWKDWGWAALAGILLAINWGVYIYAINIGKVLEGSLAYFINPLLVMMVGVLFFKEPFPPLLKFAFAMAFIGVIIQASFGDHFPWIALVLAFSFCSYGIIKKRIHIRPTQFSLMEGAICLIPAIASAYWLRQESDIALQTSDWLLLAGSGFVTGLPLFLFAIAARNLPYSLMGILQFISPSLQFLVGLLIYHEPLTWAGAACFCFIWLGVGAYLIDKWRNYRRMKQDTPVTYVE